MHVGTCSLTHMPRHPTSPCPSSMLDIRHTVSMKVLTYLTYTTSDMHRPQLLYVPQVLAHQGGMTGSLRTMRARSDDGLFVGVVHIQTGLLRS